MRMALGIRSLKRVPLLPPNLFIKHLSSTIYLNSSMCFPVKKPAEAGYLGLIVANFKLGK